MTPSELKILIVGAGPVGLTLACFLAKAGINFRIIDKRQEIPTATRAVGVNSMTLDAFSRLQILGPFIDESVVVDRTIIYWKNKRSVTVAHRGCSKETPLFLHSTQPIIEKNLNNCLKDLGGEVERGVSFISHVVRRNDIMVNLNLENKKIQDTFQLVIGCDGSQSTVRKQLEISNFVEDYAAYFLLADVDMEWESDSENSTHYYVDEYGYIMIIPIPYNKFRIIISYLGQEKEYFQELPSFKHYLEAEIKSRTGNSIKITEIIWSTSAPFRHKIAQKFFLNRIVLAGDALHTFSPIGGTNMNMGIEDASYLARTIAKIGDIGNIDSCLAQYASERFKAIMKNLRMTREMTYLMIRDVKKNKQLERKFAPLFENRSFIRFGLPSIFSALSSDSYLDFTHGKFSPN